MTLDELFVSVLGSDNANHDPFGEPSESFSGLAEECRDEDGRGEELSGHWHDGGDEKTLLCKCVYECDYYRVCRRKVFEPETKKSKGSSCASQPGRCPHCCRHGRRKGCRQSASHR